MLGTGTHAMIDYAIDYAGRPEIPAVRSDGYGTSALYRLYPAAEGWIFLAAQEESDWPALVAVLADDIELAADDRFATGDRRTANDDALNAVLATVFAQLPAADWEKRLTDHGIGCVQAGDQSPPAMIMTDPALTAEYAVAVDSPTFGEHLRMTAPLRYSRSVTTPRGGCRAGDHTIALLREIGYSTDQIADLQEREIVLST
jgi:crotonobetainyl-CoA:carnitine CoA-transferase CaiB-like acyl-CoA transferase